MPLSPQEQAELQALEAEFGDLTPEEIQEFIALESDPEVQRGLAAENTPQEGTPGQAFLEGFGQTASMGYLPQLQAGAEKGIDKLSEFLGVGPAAQDAELRKQGFNVPERTYVQARDENIARQEQQAQQDPLASLLGKGAGVAVGALAMPTGQALRGAGVGSKIAHGAKTGSAMGAVYNPGDEEGVVDPYQAQERLLNAGVGAATGGTLSALGAGVSNLADKSRMVKRIKDSAGLSRGVKKDIDAAVQSVQENYIAPRAKHVKSMVTPETMEINPERLKGISPGLDNLASRMAKKTNEAGRRQIRGDKALRLRQLLDARAGYNKSKPYDTSAIAKGEQAKKAADILREQINRVPDVNRLQNEATEAFRLTQKLKDSSRTAPISSITGRAGTDKASLVDAIDKMGGSNLESLAGNIETARNMIINPINFVKPLEAPNEVRKLIARGITGSSRIAEDAAPEESLQMILRMISEAER